ncbi:ABC transporter ATP-binding protein [Undibacterium macrobrachii]|jgi:ATP-binding cassette subfamily B protein/ATP-binding cassette subfamily C protein/ATP-binding cassette subfamily B multidrug efflux pump|uniref:Multidrug ABC transporter permease/ATP-binding protein n=1 Tax=Undibacterium macrobrachii TaxID=1119058 RepID=A0ABQ2XMC1_9BURK|nr:ABC transporter transmembrane domain-containing protein [Undibacterium macrobrachii]GGX24647.1 multidrug ABC transporter permease/ATP-binding protein [Undibacterium macrobrachii]
MTLYQLLAQFIRQHWRSYFAAAVMLFLVAALTVLIPRKIGQIIDSMVAHNLAGEALLWELATVLLMGVAIYFLRVGWRLQLFAASYRLGAQLRLRLYQRLSMQGPAFFQQQRTGDLMALGTNDADAIELAAGEAALAGFDGAMTFVLVIGMMTLGVDWRLALAALLPFPFMAWAFKKITHHVHDASKDSLERFSKLNDHVQETISGVRTLRVLGLEQRNAEQFAEMAEHAAAASLSAQKWEAAYEPAVGVALTAAGALTLGVGAYLVWQNKMSIGNLTAFSMYLGQLIWPMFAAGWVLSLLERGKAAWGRLRPVLEADLVIQDLGTIQSQVGGSIHFDKVSFSYPGQANLALNQLSFDLHAGQTLGIVGATGAGKSSVLRLLLRQFETKQGQVRWGEHRISAYPLERLRNAINWVAQEPFLFSASIASNIALSNPQASREQIMHAAELAAIHEDILRFPEAYDTPVGERGVTLSGGQKQRVAIARALLTDSPLLLLDDALSAVDTDTETRILRHLAELRLARPERSAIIVSHRLSAVAEADHILVLREGVLIEQGTHSQLLALDGWYASQWKYQQLEADLNAA